MNLFDQTYFTILGVILCLFAQWSYPKILDFMHNIYFWFPKSKDIRTVICSQAHPGRILEVYPTDASTVKKPYLVKIVKTCNEFFETELVHPLEHKNPHRRKFVYNSYEWINYHSKRISLTDNFIEK